MTNDSYISVIGTGHTSFGELWEWSFSDLLAMSQLEAIASAGIGVGDIDEIFTGTMCAGLLGNQSNVASLASHILHTNVPSTVVEGACASGGLALRMGIQAIQSGRARVVLVNGVEKMTDVQGDGISHALASAASAEWEQIHGVTFPALIAMIARVYMQEYGVSREALAEVSVKNHANGCLNNLAHLKKKITLGDVLQSPVVADPLRLLDCSPISDGAASVVLCGDKGTVLIVGSGHATDGMLLSQREHIHVWPANRIAAERAYTDAGIGPERIDVAEVHDAFSVLELMAIRDLSLTDVVINPSGGLKARGHPVGATGVAQAVEIVRQLQGACGDRQVQGARFGLTHNVGGYGSTVVVHIFQRNE